METIEKLEVYLDSAHVGTIALYKKHLAAFEYCREWLETGFSISPFKKRGREFPVTCIRDESQLLYVYYNYSAKQLIKLQ